jgi:[ribosomal protein S5]-alanine N-acetyltransferase
MARLFTARLRLEPLSAAHLPALLDIHQRNANAFEGRMFLVMRSMADAKRYLEPKARSERYALVLRKERCVVGSIALANIDSLPFSNATLGYHLDGAHSGHGYMQEAVERLVSYAFSTLKLHRIEANIAPDNKRSLKLIRRVGFRKEGVTPRMLFLCGAWRDQVRFAITKEEWTR